MRNDGHDLRSLAKEFGVSHQRISQILNVMRCSYQMDVDTTDSLPYWTGADVCMILKCPAYTLYKHFLNANLIEGEDYYYYGSKSGVRRYTYSGVKKLEDHCHRTCKVCMNRFLSHKDGVWVCTNPLCRQIANYGHTIPEALKGIALEVSEAVKGVESDDYVSIGEASQHTSLSKMQLIWLVMRGALPEKPHPTRTWRNDPVTTVSITHCKIAENIYRKHGRIR